PAPRRRGRRRATAVGPHTAAPGPLAPELPGVRGRCRGENCGRRLGRPRLALLPPAGVPLAELAATAPGGLRDVRGAALLGVLPQERPRPGVGDAPPGGPGRPEAAPHPATAAGADPAGRGAAGAGDCRSDTAGLAAAGMCL